MGKSRFLSSYGTLVKKTKDRHTPSKGLQIYELAANSITTRGKDPYIYMAQGQCVDIVATPQNAADDIIWQMQTIAQTIPKYKVLRDIPVWETVLDRLFWQKSVTFAVSIVPKR